MCACTHAMHVHEHSDRFCSRQGWSYADTGSQPPPTPTPCSLATPVRPRNLLRESPMKSPNSKPTSPMSVEKPWPAHDEPYTWHAGWWGWTPQSWNSAGWGWDNGDHESKWTWGRRDSWGGESITTAASTATPSPASEPSPSHPPTQAQQSQEVKQALNRGLTTVSEQELTQKEAEDFIAELETQIDGLHVSEEDAQKLSKLQPLDTQSTMRLDTQDMNDIAAATQQETQQNPPPETKPQQPITQEAQPQHPQDTKQQQPPSKEQAAAQEQKPPAEAKPEPATNEATQQETPNPPPSPASNKEATQQETPNPPPSQPEPPAEAKPEPAANKEATQQETPNPPPSQPEQANGRSDIIDQAKQIPVDDKWRKDKYGQILSPAALYSRFYRSARSPSPS